MGFSDGGLFPLQAGRGALVLASVASLAYLSLRGFGWRTESLGISGKWTVA
jgi:hypothetical protein